MVSLRVMVVDDEDDICQSVVDLLQRFLTGVEVRGASSGDEALRIARRWPVQLVVCDYRMPGMDGLETIRRLQEMSSRLGTVLFTAFPDVDIAKTALNRLHLDAFLTKPAEPAEILRTVSEVLLRHCQDVARDAIVAEVRAMVDA